MAYKNILVHLDSTKACAKRVAAAIELAQREEAHLVGLYVAARIVVPGYVMAQMPAQALEDQRALRQTQMQAAVDAFEAAADKAGVKYESRHTLSPAEDIFKIIGLHARYADLIVMGQDDEDDPASMGSALVENVLLTAGCPTLVVPYIGAPEGFGKKVMMAWDASRESARAAKDAMGFLQKADEVNILCVNPKFGIGDHGEQPGADIALSLARHGVKAEAQHVVAPDIKVSDTLLSRAADESIDMLIMGGYGHSRLREVIMGGVTHHILRHMTVPVLMSH
ncbi:universal stress protein [Rhodovibrionaceae bacterium A322]